MPNLLISGPAGAGKTEEARRLLQASTEPMVAADFQTLLAALTLLERQPDGRYPQRRESQASWLLPLTEYLRMAIIGAAQTRGVGVVTTNSDGSPERRALLLSRLGPGAVERVNDPGIDIVTERLSVEGTLSDPCRDAINRWYGRR
jgi:hypothetical protein